jgi:hypothetical protein
VKHYDGFGHIRIVSGLALPLRGHSTVLADVSAFIDSHQARIGPHFDSRAGPFRRWFHSRKHPDTALQHVFLPT